MPWDFTYLLCQMILKIGRVLNPNKITQFMPKKLGHKLKHYIINKLQIIVAGSIPAASTIIC